MNGPTVILTSTIPITALISVTCHKLLKWPYKIAIPAAITMTIASVVALSAAVMLIPGTEKPI